jgi:hypothetical protein
MKKFYYVLKLMMRVQGIDADPPWPDMGARKALAV